MLPMAMTNGQMLDHLASELRRAQEACCTLDERANILGEQLAKAEQECTAAARLCEAIERNMEAIFKSMRAGD